MSRFSTKAMVATLGVSALVASLVGCGGGSSSASGGSSGAKKSSCSVAVTKKSAPQVSVWAWYPNMKKVVTNFNAQHSDVQVCLTNAGQGADEYHKFQTTVSAKAGAPDVIMLEADTLPVFEIQGALVDLSKYGANSVKGNFSSGAWKDVSSGSAVYAIPVDGGPMAMMYRKDIFDKYGITPPTTWADYQTDAQKLKDAGGPLMGDLASNVPAAVTALMQQKGVVPWTYKATDKTKLKIDLNDANSKDVLNYWAGLVKGGLVGTQDQFTTDYISGVVSGKYATYISAAWAPGYLTGAGAGSGADKGTWAVAPLPQWDTTKPVSVNWGGSTFAVTSQSKQPKLAAEVAKGLYADKASLRDGASNQIIFPLNQGVLKADWFVDNKVAFFSGQTANKEVYIPAENAYRGSVYSPFSTSYYAQFTKDIAAINGGTKTGSQAADDLQSTMETYAKQQGFTLQ